MTGVVRTLDPDRGEVDVSVVVPTHNRAALLVKTLVSALQQQDVQIEVIVVDDASSDDTAARIARLGDARVRLVRLETPCGLPGARNHGAAAAAGEWLAFLDDDDLWAPDKLARQLHAATRAGRDWAYAGSVNFEDGRIVYSRPPLPPDDVMAALPRYNAIPGGGSNVLVRRAVWSAAGPFDTRLPMGEDWEMWIRLARHGPPAWVCSPLMAKRVHPSNLSLSTTRFVRGTKLIEEIHHISVDWGHVHRWLAERHLRSGHRAAAVVRLLRAALRGHTVGVLSDVGGILRRRVRHVLRGGQPVTDASDPWREAALTWLRELEDGIH